MTRLDYLHYDVFTDRRFEGNQLAVFPDGRGLDPAMMQTIAREMNFSETTFILPKEREGTDVRMRIFTPGVELPMAGHPTIGSTFALAHLGVIARGSDRFVFELGVGPTPVELSWNDEGLSFAWMDQRPPEVRTPAMSADDIIRAVGVDASAHYDDGPAGGRDFLRGAVHDAATEDPSGGRCRGAGHGRAQSPAQRVRQPAHRRPGVHDRSHRAGHHRLQPHVRTRAGRPRGSRDGQRGRPARLLPRDARTGEGRRTARDGQLAGRADGPTEPHLHCHRARRRGTRSRGCRWEGRPCWWQRESCRFSEYRA